jgi:tetratricopeptide (TPR) repeat protein
MTKPGLDETVTFVLPVQDDVEQARMLLGSIARHTTSLPYQVLIIDRGSRPASDLESLASERAVRVLRTGQELGLFAAFNLGVQRANSMYVVLLHGNLRVTRGWLPQLLGALRAAPGAGLVAPSLSAARCAQRVILGTDTTSEEMEDSAAHLARRLLGQVEDVAFLETQCLFGTRATFQAVGRFVEDFHLESHGAADFCRRARKLGLRLLIARGAVLFRPATDSADLDQANQGDLVHDKLLLKRRWASDPFWRGVELAAIGDHVAALTLFEEVVGTQPNRVDALLKQALSLYTIQRSAEALPVIDRYLESCPRAKDALFVKAQILVALERSGEALVLLEEVERSYYLEPAEQRELFHTIASLHRLQKRANRALDYLHRALDCGHASADLYMALLETAAETGEPSLFAGALECLVDADPRNVKLRLELGAALNVAGNREAAKRAYRHAIKLDPNCQEARNKLDLLEDSSS